MNKTEREFDSIMQFDINLELDLFGIQRLKKAMRNGRTATIRFFKKHLRIRG